VEPHSGADAVRHARNYRGFLPVGFAPSRLANMPATSSGSWASPSSSLDRRVAFHALSRRQDAAAIKPIEGVTTRSTARRTIGACEG